MNWQPIETAPKDGTEILTWDDLFGYQVAHWGEYEHPLNETLETGWTDGLSPVLGDSGEPTHWTPLEPPQE